MLFCNPHYVLCGQRIEIPSHLLFGVELSINILSHKERVSADKVVELGYSYKCFVAAANFPAWLGATVYFVSCLDCFH